MSTPNLRQRCHDPEIMDDLLCSGEVVTQTLRELDVINRWLGGNAVTLSAIRKMLKARSQEDGTVSIADLGCGSGDMLRRLAAYGRSVGIRMKLTGIDANPHIIAYARQQSADYPELTFETLNVLSADFASHTYDIIAGTLFFHHFDDVTLERLLPQLVRQSRIGVVINDIHRHPIAYHSIRLLTRLFSRSAMVRYDAPLSVQRSFRRADWERMLDLAGLLTYQMRWKWAFRWKILLPATGSRLAQFW